MHSSLTRTRGHKNKNKRLEQEQEARMRSRTATCRKDFGEFNGICCRADDSRHLGLPLRSAHVNFSESGGMGLEFEGYYVQMASMSPVSQAT